MPRRIDREGPVQRDIVDWLRAVLPAGCIVHHCKNEINKRGSNIARELAQAKRNGAVTGFPDLVVIPFDPAPVVFLEVKAPGNYPSPEQKEVHADLRALGRHVYVVRSIDDARAALLDAGVGFREVDHRT